ncbi:hypothetical protein OIDMADRAFT_142494 [Oidiodendron maius Zn]|uniref:Uncharacterized protein n=1 Tax=Oidiodendron maius (strain Zn) TaxID=913774 RepID=A0A0C3HNR3_OIDMZ|nr:hypothetical protein OIDMADRAFT_142494 [Oidiodendron maius Zn]
MNAQCGDQSEPVDHTSNLHDRSMPKQDAANTDQQAQDLKQKHAELQAVRAQVRREQMVVYDLEAALAKKKKQILLLAEDNAALELKVEEEMDRVMNTMTRDTENWLDAMIMTAVSVVSADLEFWRRRVEEVRSGLREDEGHT